MSWIMELRGVSKRYGSVVALDSVGLKVRRGEILSVVGPNGSGKTTLLRLMALIEKPTSGEISFNGTRVNDASRSQIRTRVTLVFQRSAAFNTSVYKNIAYGLKLRGYSKKDIDRKVKEVLDLVELQGYEQRSARSLSGGEQQRVSLARAIVLDVELLLLDEPTANLDPKNSSIIEDTISRVNRDFNTSVVMATPDMFLGERIANRIAVLLNGKIEDIGTISEILQSRPIESIAGFARLENVFSGTSRILEEGTSLIDLGDGVEVEAAIRRPGRVTMVVKPEDIIVSKKPMRSSARNSFEGKIVGILDLGPVVKLRIDAGKRFIAKITKRSFVDMQLKVDSEVFLAFKASSVKLV